MSFRTRLTSSVALAGCVSLAAAATSGANTITVSSTADSGAGSIRAALAAAGSGDTVSVPSGTYVLSSGQLSIPAGVTVAGDGARITVINANHTSRVMQANGANVTVSGLTLTGGQAAGGAGILSSTGLTLSRVAIYGNNSTTQGGGVSSDGAFPFQMDHSLVANNSGVSGAGLSIGSSVPGSKILASTIAGNQGTGVGAGFSSDALNLVLDSVTLFGNKTTSQGGNFRLNGGTDASFRNTVTASGLSGVGDNCYLSSGSVLTSLGHNAEDTDANPDSDCQGSFVGTDRKNLLLNVGPLQNNGGPTDTISPLPGSPLVDTGDTTACPTTTDQRGVPRAQGASCDVGAVEAAPVALGAVFGDGVTSSTVTLHANADTLGLGGTGRFAYGPTTAYGAYSPQALLPATLGASSVTMPLEGLDPSTTYHFRFEATGRDVSANSIDGTFTTSAASTPPPTPTPTATSVTPSGLKATKTGATVKLSCDGPVAASCKGVASLRATRKVRGKRVVTTIASKNYTIGIGKSTTVTLTLSKAGKALLKKSKKLSVTLRVSLDSAPALPAITLKATK